MGPLLKNIKPSIDANLWNSVQRYLFDIPLEDEDVSESNISKDESSQWETVDTDSEASEQSSDENSQSEKAATKSKRRQEAWLQNIQVATIPTFELFVFVRNGRIGAFESNGEGGQWQILFRKELQDTDVTAVVCLPVAPTRVSDPRPYEWTAILAGTADGRVIAFNERGDELLSQRLHIKPVIEMRLESDQLLVTYPDYLTTISGFTLLAALKTNRQRLMRQHVSHRSQDENQTSDAQLVYEHWKLENTTQPTSVVAAGPHRTTIWEKLVTASVKGGFNASVSNRQPSYETYCATNTKNFVSFNWWTDDTPPNLLAGIASKIKSSVSVPLFSSWWSPSKSSPKPSDGTPSTTVAPITSRDVSQRSCLPDNGRVGVRLVLLPGNRLSAVCDDLGRVSMFDMQQRLLLRMWKGYRDAQCVWIELPYSGTEKKGNDENRGNVLCVIIYTPRRGILEVWSAQNGRLAAAFNVDRKGTLLYCPQE